MADIKKDQERDELHKAIWAIADELRGSVDGWDFKSYVLGMMFYRYISDKMYPIKWTRRAAEIPCCGHTETTAVP